MESICKIASDIEFWKIMAPVLTVVVGWLLNEKARRQAELDKRIFEQRKKKEESYRILLKSSKGFSEGQEDAELLKLAFLDELQLCWLHASDDVIKKIYAFIDSVHTDSSEQIKAQKEHLFAEFVAALRNDTLSHKLIERSDLKSKDYRLLKPNDKKPNK
ncbi:hypothetical protein [Nitrincola tapanii]|uniref:DUF2489 domain-containing protein n=1 Tax=Nitrincola tapanii TaxID=1708751 RepID=A0A5A9W8B3_9GAMM|nr:hypothetical protein [Nitrincola tapanii]KAA0876358.1 hypothetical protein E1H14_01105 [Nitrincola tapanii]